MTEDASVAYRGRQDWEIAGFYCEHQSLGHTCQNCRDTVVDVLCAMRDAGFAPPSARLRPPPDTSWVTTQCVAGPRPHRHGFRLCKGDEA